MNNLTKVLLFTALSGTLLYGAVKKIKNLARNKQETKRRLLEKQRVRRQLLRSQISQ